MRDEHEETSPGEERLSASGMKEASGGVRPCLVVLAGERPGRTYRLDGNTIIGRGADTAVRLPLDDVSRHHARIVHEESGAYRIDDLESRNGIRVNGVPISSQRLAFGDRVTIGPSSLLLFTQQDGLEEQLLRSQKLESLGRLAGGIAHDFNNLLGTVLTNISYLRSLDAKTKLDHGDVVETLEDSEAALRRAVELTRQLLGFARRGKYRDHPTNISELVEDVARLVRRTVHKSVRIQLDVEPGVVVMGDATQLHQVLMNIYINACDAIGEEGGVLQVHVERRAPDVASVSTRVQQAVIEIKDDGQGMDEDTRSRAFEPFFTTKDVGKGTGLGLAMVYGIVKNHGGDVHVDSTQGAGTIVRVVLPTTPDLAETNKKSTAASDEPMIGGRLLLVDDDDLFRASARRLLEHLGYRVDDVASGAEALEFYEKRGPELDLVLLDLQMPQMSGELTLGQLRELNPKINVLLVTAFADDSRARSAIAAGARGFIQKPFDIDALQRAILEATDDNDAPA